MSKGSKKGEKTKSKGKVFFPLLISVVFFFSVKFSFAQEGKIQIIKGLQSVSVEIGFQFQFSPGNDNHQWGFAYDYSEGTYTTDSHPDSEKWNVGTLVYYTLEECKTGYIESTFENSFRFKITDTNNNWVAKIRKKHDPRLGNQAGNSLKKYQGYNNPNNNNTINITWVLMKRIYYDNGEVQDVEVAEVGGYGINGVEEVVTDIPIDKDPEGNIIYWIKYILPFPAAGYAAGDYEASDHAFDIVIQKQ